MIINFHNVQYNVLFNYPLIKKGWWRFKRWHLLSWHNYW